MHTTVTEDEVTHPLLTFEGSVEHWGNHLSPMMHLAERRARNYIQHAADCFFFFFFLSKCPLPDIL